MIFLAQRVVLPVQAVSSKHKLILSVVHLSEEVLTCVFPSGADCWHSGMAVHNRWSYRDRGHAGVGRRTGLPADAWCVHPGADRGLEEGSRRRPREGTSIGSACCLLLSLVAVVDFVDSVIGVYVFNIIYSGV